jgi:hypothetical protein
MLLPNDFELSAAANQEYYFEGGNEFDRRALHTANILMIVPQPYL